MAGRDKATTTRCRGAGRLDRELDRSAPLAEGESVMVEGLVRCRTSPLFNRPAFIRITAWGVYLVQHYALQPDRLVRIPLGAILAVDPSGGPLRLRVDGEGGPEELVLVSWLSVPTRVRPVEPVLEFSAADLATLLQGP